MLTLASPTIAASAARGHVIWLVYCPARGIAAVNIAS
jgi:hypothetical protein